MFLTVERLSAMFNKIMERIIARQNARIQREAEALSAAQTALKSAQMERDRAIRAKHKLTAMFE
ncbi:hypothetical protein [Bowmanella yangjiangensis]|uniref:Uncharacterized protein n=1 Tax=Bowmanella yangjiangensis TaxID=2811230 RepID=A0ABS3CTS0_9ALTE|nr:hypothetical protein [Bowmanella yangjiangensis]MBN7820517.1 hypothetical protein [Bowmanella yangjiangensis]